MGATHTVDSAREMARARTWSRRIAIQALYQHQVSGSSLKELMEQFRDEAEFPRCDAEFLEDALRAVIGDPDAWDGRLDGYLDRPVVQLDPVEHAILWLGFWEFVERIETPYRVVIDQGVELAKRFGAEDGHRFVNAVLDRASKDLRSAEVGAAR